MNRKKILKYIGIALLIVILIIGVPILINELYKIGPGYVTMWEASDVLSYYGTILGAVIAVGTLVVTIWFTRKQIERESYLKSENEKWGTLEELSMQYIQNIDPTQPLRLAMENGKTDIFRSIHVFQQYQMTCRTSTDYFLAYLGEEEFNSLQKLLQQISEISEFYFKFAEKAIKSYTKIADLRGRNDALKMLDTEMENPGTFTAESIAYCERIVQNTNGITLQEIQRDIIHTNEEMASAYDEKYRPLLQLHRNTFHKINEEVQKQADSMLYPWRK